jgi:hypothetical protein
MAYIGHTENVAYCTKKNTSHTTALEGVCVMIVSTKKRRGIPPLVASH